MAEAMSYMAGSELPIVLVNVMRGGPGLGSIGPSQSDYFQVVKGHGHGDYRVPVLAPASIAEAMALVADAFEIAERYRTPVDHPRRRDPRPGDGAGRARVPEPARTAVDWAADGADGRAAAGRQARSTSCPRISRRTTGTCRRSSRRSRRARSRWAGEELDDAELVIVAYGTAARVARTAIERARAAGLRVGLFRPITLWPFPRLPLARARHEGPRHARRRAVGGPDGRGRAPGRGGRAARSGSTGERAAWCRRPERSRRRSSARSGPITDPVEVRASSECARWRRPDDATRPSPPRRPLPATRAP